MTREEAKDVLKEISATLKSWNGFTKYPQALDMAIEALSLANPKEEFESAEETIEIKPMEIKGDCSHGERKDK